MKGNDEIRNSHLLFEKGTELADEIKCHYRLGEERGRITGSHEKVKFVEQAPLEAGWVSENMVVLFSWVFKIFLKSLFFKTVLLVAWHSK